MPLSEGFPSSSRIAAHFRPVSGPFLGKRLLRLVLGLVLFGVGAGLMIEADLGNSPWTVFHQGLSVTFGLSIGTWTVLAGVAVLLLWIPLRERYGLGTLLNVLMIGPVIDATTALVPTPTTMLSRGLLLGAGVVAIGAASGYYIGSHLGPGPRDGLMTAIAARGPSVRATRFSIEASVLAVGWLLGGRVGVGTLVFTIAIGPLVQFFLRRLEVAGVPAARGRTLLH